MLPGKCLTCAINCFPSILIWPIQIHHYFSSMFSGSLSNIIKTVITIVFSMMQLSLSTCFEYLNASRNMFDMCNVLSSFNYDMANLNPSLFFINGQWKLVQHYKNSNYHSVFYDAIVTVNLF